jgi:two-component system sensor histidine kinase PilS (NtrC family)
MKYAETGGKKLKISMHSLVDQNGAPCLDISNNGKARPDEQIDRLFEPFYTTDSKGTGLGLYLSREFCLLNGANIEYYCDRQSHCFRISFGLMEPEQ